MQSGLAENSTHVVARRPSWTSALPPLGSIYKRFEDGESEGAEVILTAQIVSGRGTHSYRKGLSDVTRKSAPSSVAVWTKTKLMHLYSINTFL